MERRGFIGKFGKVVAGAVLSADYLMDEERRKSMPRHLPIVVKVHDETILREGNIIPGTLEAMFKAGLKAIYPDISEDDFLPTLFPGMMRDEIIGLKIYGIPELPKHIGALLTSLVNSIKSFPHEDMNLERENIIAWAGGKISFQEIGINEDECSNFSLRSGEEDEIDPETEYPLELEGFELIPYPLLTRLCRYQIGVVCSMEDLKEKHSCRDNYLSCFRREGFPDWPKGADARESGKAYESVCYPLGMKFRLHILDRIMVNNTMIICSDGALIDGLFPDEGSPKVDLPLKLVKIENPSAPLISDLSLRRRGDDMEITWNDPEYEGRYQIYRNANEGFTPAKRHLIGITRRRKFTDTGGAKVTPRCYRITREWGM